MKKTIFGIRFKKSKSKLRKSSPKKSGKVKSKVTREIVRDAINEDKIHKEALKNESIYKENILDHYRHPHNKRILPQFNLRHREVNPLCGDELVFYLDVQKGMVKEISFMGNGCAISQAAASMLTDEVKGKLLKNLSKTIDTKTILKMLGVPVSPARMKCALLSLKTLLKALEESEYVKDAQNN